MSWKVFAGDHGDAIAALVTQRASSDGFSPSAEGVSICLRAHIQRGLGYLASDKDTDSIGAFFARWLKSKGNHK